jgi:hypothetical protein
VRENTPKTVVGTSRLYHATQVLADLYCTFWKKNETELHLKIWQDDYSEYYLMSNDLGIFSFAQSLEKYAN